MNYKRNPYYNGNYIESLKDEESTARFMNMMTIFGGCEVGFNTNPKTKTEKCFLEVGKEKNSMSCARWRV